MERADFACVYSPRRRSRRQPFSAAAASAENPSPVRGVAATRNIQVPAAASPRLAATEYPPRYLEEAHPTDGWLYESVTHLVKQATTDDERRAAAALLAEELRKLGEVDATVVVDSLSNYASLAFGALPERLAIVRDGRLVFLGGKGPEEYSVGAAREALAAMLGA